MIYDINGSMMQRRGCMTRAEVTMSKTFLIFSEVVNERKGSRKMILGWLHIGSALRFSFAS